MRNNGVDVLIPCYNSAAYIRDTLNSVLCQSYGLLCIYAVDDGSTDETLSILNEYYGKIKILQHADFKNHGQAAALNLALSHSNSEYIAFMDADDLWHPDKILKQSSVLDSKPEIGLIYTDGDVIDSYGNNLYGIIDSDHVECNGPDSILLNCYIRTPSQVMIRRSIIDDIGQFTIGITPDHDMWIRAKEKTKFYFLKEKLTYYRSHNNQLSKTNNNKMWTDAFKVLYMALERYPYSARTKYKRLAVINYRLGLYYLSTKSFRRAVFHLATSFFLDPLRALHVLVKTKANIRYES